MTRKAGESANLARSAKGETIADGVTFMWPPVAGFEPVTLQIGGDEMVKKQDGIAPRGKFPEWVRMEQRALKSKFVSFHITATSAKQMAFRVVWVLDWLDGKGWGRVTWITRSATECAGYAKEKPPQGGTVRGAAPAPRRSAGS